MHTVTRRKHKFDRPLRSDIHAPQWALAGQSKRHDDGGLKKIVSECSIQYVMFGGGHLLDAAAPLWRV